MTTLEQIRALALNGIGIKGVEATIGRKLTEAEATEYHKAATIRRLQRAKAAQDLKRERAARLEREGEEALARMRAEATHDVGDAPDNSLALSSTERSRAHRARGREIAAIPPRRHKRVYESCRFNLLRFGLIYATGKIEEMSEPLLCRAPSPRMERFVAALQDKILHGGLKHVRWPRGKGKSTWVKIAIMWAALYGHKRFMVVVEKTKGMAFVVVDEIWKRIYMSPKLSADFPEFAVPMRDVALAPQRMRVQTYHGRPTLMKMDVTRFNFYKLPIIHGFDSTGAIIAFRGSDQALRGINIESSRPDFFFIDDPQTNEEAANPKTVENIENNITKAVLGSGKTSERISAVMASTPIEPDDVSERFADPKRHPEWEAETEQFVVSWGDDNLTSAYIAKLEAADACPAYDVERKAELQAEARQFYIDNRAAIEAGAEMMDERDFDPETEVSAYQHACWLLHIMKPQSFHAEMQMTPTRSQGIYKIDPFTVSSRVNAVDYGIIPGVCERGALAFMDVNINAGLRWELGAFGPGRIVATLAYGEYHGESGRIVPENTPTSAIPEYLAAALRVTINNIFAARLHDSAGRPVACQGLCIDGGWQTETVATVIAEYAQKGYPIVWSRGFASSGYSRYHHSRAAELERLGPKQNPKGLRAREECHLWEVDNGVFLAYNADYWKEVSQTSYLRGPLSPSSSSFWGDNNLTHFKFAQEVCAEELESKEESTKYGSVWRWRKDRNKPNHFGDCHAGLLVYGAIRDFYDPVTSVISPDALPRIYNLRKKVNYVVKGL